MVVLEETLDGTFIKKYIKFEKLVSIKVEVVLMLY